ncbi:MAG: hypothetical protein PWQ51_2264 [Methanolobus sp.]|jgi:hypothetical protein|nr:hypothetical protein [Methanolobus sp.]
MDRDGLLLQVSKIACQNVPGLNAKQITSEKQRPGRNNVLKKTGECDTRTNYMIENTIKLTIIKIKIVLHRFRQIYLNSILIVY